MQERGRIRNELARCINRAAYATRHALKPGYDREGCKQTAHDYMVRAIAARELLKRIDVIITYRKPDDGSEDGGDWMDGDF